MRIQRRDSDDLRPVSLLVPLLSLLLLAAPALSAERDPETDVHYERGAHALRMMDGETAVAELSVAAERAPEDPQVLGVYARALLLAQRPAEAIEVIERVRAIDPAAPDIDYMEGLAHYRLHQWQDTVDHLAVVREIDPRNARARLFLGIAYDELGRFEEADREFQEAVTLDPTLQSYIDYRQGLVAASADRDREAREHFEEVMRQVPGSKLADSAASRIKGLGKRDDRRWRAYAILGFAYDTNVNLGGGGDAVAISDETDYRGTAEAGLEALAFRSDRLDVRVGYTGFFSMHRNEKDLDVEANELWARANYAINERFTAELSYEFDWIWADFESFRRTHGIEPGIRVSARRDLFARFFFRWEKRDFFDKANFVPDGAGGAVLPSPPGALDRDGSMILPGADVYWLVPDVFGWGRNVVRVGARYRSEDTSGNDFRSHGPIGVATLTLALPSRARLIVEGWYEKRSFKHASNLTETTTPGVPGGVPLAGSRSDKISQFRIRFQRPLNDQIWLEGGWRWVHWSSNVKTYDFDRAVTDLRIGYRF
jgi:Flp pilus assembly protein TadD